MSESSPTLSIGLAVRNGHDVVGRCIESVLSQDFADLELVVADNVSDDGTVELLERYARDDPRLRFVVNDSNIGSHVNMVRVLELSRGRYFRWISADDWLEPRCLSACVDALEARDDAIGVTTFFTIHDEDAGRSRHEEYRGEFPTSPDPARRLERMLWFFHAGDAKYDPIYGMYRRDALNRARRLRPSERADWLLSAELALMGPILNLDRRLYHRTRSYAPKPDRAAFRRRLDPAHGERLRTSARRMYRELVALAVCADLDEEQLRRCRRAARHLWVREVARHGHERAAAARHQLVRRGLEKRVACGLTAP